MKEKKSNRYSKCEYVNVIPYKKNLSVQRFRSHIGFAKSIYVKLNMLAPDMIYALVPPNSVAKYCAQYKIRHSKVKLIFDIIDMWPESIPIKGLRKTLPFFIWRNYRDASLKYADYVFTECALYQVYLEKYLPKKYSTLYLYKELEFDCKKKILSIVEKKRNQQNTNTIILGYLGSINHIIDIDGIKMIVSALNKKYDVLIKIIGDGERRKVFIETLKNIGVRVEFYGKIFDDKKKFEILFDCDYALNMMIDRVRVGLTIKSIDYFSYGLPLINNIKGDTWRLIDDYNIGINFNGDIKEFLNKIEHSDVEMHMKAYEIYQNEFSKESFRMNVKKGMDII